MQLGVSLPVVDIGTGPTVVRDYAQAAEALGYAHLVAPDHVLGANPAADPAGRRVGTTANPYHDPFVLFGSLAGCTQRIGFAVGVLILAQRQAVLVAKQAASLDVLCGGRFHAVGLPSGRRGIGGIRQAAPVNTRGGSRSGTDGYRGVGIARRQRR
jgi:alkanesulfonate monooxygenase SsuD/methylene tetrahydromethanopterin reductase-like flavin-dependent oxidoreductase (luciferase family)